MSTRCLSCGSEANGNFCSQCGGALAVVRNCSACANEIPPGGRFCNLCGLAATEEPATSTPAGLSRTMTSPPRGSRAVTAPIDGASEHAKGFPWVMVGVALVILAVAFFGLRTGSDDADRAPAQPSAGPTGATAGSGAAGIDLSSMSAREAADRLFDRVMRAASSGDTAQARTFAPMALAAYDLVDDLDIDARYHLALIHLVNGNAAAARAEADAILDRVPTHLFGLLTGAQAARLAGDTENARSLYEQLLNNYEAEVAGGRPEYFEHEAALQPMRDEASAYLSGQGQR